MIPLRVGDVLYGYCGGCFDHASYNDKRVEAIGADWVVAREDSYGDHAIPLLFNGNPEVLTKYRTKPEDDY